MTKAISTLSIPPFFDPGGDRGTVAPVESGRRGGAESLWAAVAGNRDLTESALRNWVKRAEIDAGRGEGGEPTTDELEELRRLRRENRTLRMERDFLKKAAAFFAKEQDRPLS